MAKNYWKIVCFQGFHFRTLIVSKLTLSNSISCVSMKTLIGHKWVGISAIEHCARFAVYRRSFIHRKDHFQINRRHLFLCRQKRGDVALIEIKQNNSCDVIWHFDVAIDWLFLSLIMYGESASNRGHRYMTFLKWISIYRRKKVRLFI